MTDKQQVLIADDDTVHRTLIEGLLAKWGFEPKIASNGEEACRLLLADNHPQLAIVDWQMPKLDGIDVCRAVRERHSMSDVFVLMLTARRESNDLAEALNAGANDYISKPFDGTELKARLTVGLRLIGSMVVTAESLTVTGTSPSSNRNECITPVFDPHRLKFGFGLPAALLRTWESDGTLQRVLLDRVQVCPQCHSLPTFRFGCSACGSGCMTNDKMIHHFACAHVGTGRDFDEDGELVCPKCRTRRLVVGADFEYLTGPYRCLDCNWSARELEHIAHCLGCSFRFPASAAVMEDLVGFTARQHDPERLSTLTHAGNS